VELVIATSGAVAAELGDARVRSYGREEMLGILAQCSYACMTPGLGNIYDAAAFDIPTLWLPGANDSQGRQRQQLTRHRCSDGHIDWSDLGTPVDYGAAQPVVLRDITAAVRRLRDDPAGQRAFTDLLAAKLSRLSGRLGSRTRELTTVFGSGGDVQVSEFLLEHSRSLMEACA
jgi:hypothetical protein